MGVPSEEMLLPTIISRCDIAHLQDKSDPDHDQKFTQDIQNLLTQSYEKRFQYIEKLDDREGFLKALTAHFRKELMDSGSQLSKQFTKSYLQDLIKAEQWNNHNVNIRAILEYLILKMPKPQKL